MSDRRDQNTSSSLSQRMKQFEIQKVQRVNSQGNNTDGSFANENDDFQPRERLPLLVRYPPPKTTIAAALLTIGGIIFLSLGLSILYSRMLTSGKDRGLAMVILGSIMLLPGSYASFIIFASWRRWQGYDYSMLPSYDDD